MTAFKILSWNVRGLKDRKKRRSIFRQHFAVLQETHSTPDCEQCWRSEWGSNVLFSHGSNLSKGVCILVPRGFGSSAEILNCGTCLVGGRALFVKLNLNNIVFKVLGLYAPTHPTSEQVDFFTNVKALLNAQDDLSNLIIAGDLNVHLSDLDVDRAQRRTRRPAEVMNETINELGLMDVWRHFNPGKARFTWRRRNPFQQSRIDYFIISETISCVNKVEKCV